MKPSSAQLEPARKAGGRSAQSAGQVVLLLTSGQAYAPEIDRLLALMSVPVQHCATGAEALACLQRDTYRCLVSAADPPDMSSLQLIGALHRHTPELPVIIVAEAVELDSTVAAMRAGAHAIIDARQLRSGLLRNVPGLAGGG